MTATDTQPEGAAAEESAQNPAKAESNVELKVIKASEAVERDVASIFARRSPRVVKARVIDSLEQLGVDVDQARRQADALLADARQEAKRLRAEAIQEGRAEGLEQLLSQMAQTRREYTEVVEAAEQDMLDLAFRLARRIVGRTVELEPTTVREMVAGVLRHARGKRDIEVRVNPQDLDVLESARETMADQVDGVPVHFEADGQLERGSCVIHTESGRVDGRIDTRLETLRRALHGS